MELGCFRLDEVIGRGSFGVTYRAEQLGLDRDVVVKIPHADLLDSRDGELLRHRFEDEVRAATRVEHPNLVTLYTAGETSDGLPAIVMELVRGDLLEDLLVAHPGGLPHALLVPAFAQLASALSALHGADVVHRDLSPRNIMVDTTGRSPRIKVLDFGVARLRGRPQHTMGAVGTPRYMAPEQLFGRAVPASDMFSLGAILWWALTGEEYRRNTLNIEDLYLASLEGHADADPRTIVPQLPERISTLTERLLSQDERERPSAEELIVRWPEATAELRGRTPERRARPIAPSRRSVGPASIGTEGARSVHGERAAQEWSEPPASGAIDRAVLDAVYADDPMLLRETIEMFLGLAPEALARIAEHHEAADSGAVHDQCRSLCTSARALGASHLARLARAAAKRVAEGDLQSIPGLASEMEREYTRVFRALMDVHASTHPGGSR